MPPLLHSQGHLPQTPRFSEELLERGVKERERERPVAPLHQSAVVTSSLRHVGAHLFSEKACHFVRRLFSHGRSLSEYSFNRYHQGGNFFVITKPAGNSFIRHNKGGNSFGKKKTCLPQTSFSNTPNAEIPSKKGTRQKPLRKQQCLSETASIKHNNGGSILRKMSAGNFQEISFRTEHMHSHLVMVAALHDLRAPKPKTLPVSRARSRPPPPPPVRLAAPPPHGLHLGFHMAEGVLDEGQQAVRRLEQ